MYQLPVDDRAEGAEARLGSLERGVLDVQDRLGRQGGEALPCRRHPGFRGQDGGHPLGLRGGEEGVRDALCDRSAEQAPRGGRGQEQGGRGRARRLAEDRHLGGVATEGADVALHPLQCRDLVAQPAVVRDSGEMAEPLETETVVEGDHHHAGCRQLRGVEVGPAGGTVLEPATVDPLHDRQPGPAEVRGPDVHRQAVQPVTGAPGRGGPRRR